MLKATIHLFLVVISQVESIFVDNMKGFTNDACGATPSGNKLSMMSISTLSKENKLWFGALMKS